MSGLLTFTITLPIIGALLLLLIPNRDGAKDGVIRYTALGVSLLTFVLTLLAWLWFDQMPAARDFQFVERYSWIPQFGIEYYVGIDGLSLMLLVLTGFLTPLALLS